ncbi:MAG: tetratricopeptide repeat protein [Hyphomicrobium sp.]
MRMRAAAVLAAVAASFFALPVCGQDTAPVAGASSSPSPSESAELGRLKAEALSLMKSGKFADAIEPAKRALALSESIHGAQAIEAGIAAHNLGFLLKRAGRTDEARDSLERAWGIYDVKLPAIHEDVRNIAGELGLIYQAQGRSEDVVRMYTGLIERAGREGYGAHIGTAHHHNNLAFVLRGVQKIDESRDHWRKAMAIYAALPPPVSDSYQIAAEALLGSYLQAADYDGALKLAEEALAKIAPPGQPNPGAMAKVSQLLADIANAAGRYPESRSWASKAVAIAETMPEPEHNRLAGALNSLARAERALANHASAEALYLRAIPLMEAQGQLANTGIMSDNLAVLYGEMGRYELAEPHHKRALQLLEQALGREHRVVGEAAGNFGAFLIAVGRYGEAGPLLLRNLEIAAAQTPPDPVALAIVNDNLAAVYRHTGRQQEAGARLRQSLDLMEKSLPAGHPRIATTLTNLGRYLIDTGAWAGAETHLLKALAIEESVYGPGHPAPAQVRNNLGDLYNAMGRWSEARAQFKKSIEVLTSRLGPEHTDLLIPLVGDGTAALADGKIKEATDAFQQAVTIDLAQRTRGAGLTHLARGGMMAERQAYAGLVEALWQSRRPPQPADATHDEASELARALDAGQWETISPAGLALSALAARFSSGDPILAGLVREWQDLAVEWTGRDNRLTALLSQTGARDAALETQLRARLSAIELRRADVSKILQQTFPRFGELAAPSPVTISDVQTLLAPHEAVVHYYVADGAAHVWVLTKTQTRWERLPIKQTELNTLVQALRCGLDQAQWRDGSGAACATWLGLDPKHALKAGAPLPFSLERAHGLYTILMGPIAEAIKGKDLLIVPSGPLTALPFGVLVSAKPAAGESYARAAWLINDHAVTMLPSLASLKALRQNVMPSHAVKPFIGIGNPLLTGVDGTDKRAWARQSCATAAAPVSSDTASFPLAASIQTLLRGGLVNVAALRQQPALPETAGELCTVARFLNADDGSVLLGERATEQGLKALSKSGALAGVRVVHFATHGLLARETALFSGARAEPALLLTPPEKTSHGDDGLLMASEVANLKLDADWVVLSACNTAGGDGAGAESLSGLARAFFYAGARAMLVSHWAVDSDAAVKLVTGAFGEMSKDPSVGRAEALRRASMALIKGGERQAHPAYWAPFVVAGEGGATGQGVALLPAASILPAPIAVQPAAVEPAVAVPVAPAPVGGLAVSGSAATARDVVAPAPPLPTATNGAPPNTDGAPVKPRPSKPRAKRKKPDEDWSPKMFGEW